MAITVTMAYMGWIDFPTSAAIVLGENIGTTVTAYLASIGTNVNARRTARAHLVFNLLGVFWMAFLFKFFVSDNGIIYKLAPWDPLKMNNDGLLVNLPLNLSLFHTVFNLLNTLLFVMFIPLFAKLITKLVKEKDNEIRDHYELKYISGGLQETPQMNLLKARNEITSMGNLTYNMFNSVVEVLMNPNKKLGEIVDKTKKMEELTDQMQEEITKFLVDVNKEQLDEQSVINLNAMMRIVNELENIGDSCYKLIVLAQKRYDKKMKFHENALMEMKNFSTLIQEFTALYKENMNEHLAKRVLDVAYKLEAEINNFRDNLKKQTQIRLQKGGDVKSELLYLDILKHFEHIGDNSLNISQALRKIR